MHPQPYPTHQHPEPALHLLGGPLQRILRQLGTLAGLILPYDIERVAADRKRIGCHTN